MTTPTIQALLSRPCRACGGTEFTHMPKFYIPNPNSAYGFTLVACRQCRLTDLFADIAELEAHKHEIVRVPPAAPFR